VKSACQKATTSSPRWLAYGSGQQCIDFEQVLPDRIPVAQTAVVSFNLQKYKIKKRKKKKKKMENRNRKKYVIDSLSSSGLFDA
jgi:hypothetical protein